MRRSRSARPLVTLAASVALALSGCLPGTSREDDRSLAPSDSASVAVAGAAPVDSLRLVWAAGAPDADPMPFPTGIAWLADPDSAGRDGARLAVVETQNGSVRLFSPEGRYVGARWMAESDRYPYLAGVRGDTVVVHSRGAGQLDWVTDGGIARRLDVPEGTMGALVTGAGVWVRTGGGPKGGPGALLRLSEAGRMRGRHPIAGAGWRATGYVRAWGGAVLALSGYRPVVDVWTPRTAAGAALDTLALVGFDSPQLARSAQFLRGDAKEPPLLTSSAAALGEHLLVLNLRSDAVRVDVYGRDGRLARVLTSRPTGQIETLFPVDLAVRQRGGAVEIAVLMQRPSGFLQSAASEVRLYRWRLPGGANPAP